jgi:hypothetical protein
MVYTRYSTPINTHRRHIVNAKLKKTRYTPDGLSYTAVYRRKRNKKTLAIFADAAEIERIRAAISALQAERGFSSYAKAVLYALEALGH